MNFLEFAIFIGVCGVGSSQGTGKFWTLRNVEIVVNASSVYSLFTHIIWLRQITIRLGVPPYYQNICEKLIYTFPLPWPYFAKLKSNLFDSLFTQLEQKADECMLFNELLAL